MQIIHARLLPLDYLLSRVIEFMLTATGWLTDGLELLE